MAEGSEMRTRAALLRPCGTNAAYYRHRKNGEEPCEPCKEAQREYMRQYKGVVKPRGPRARPIGVRPECGTQYAYKLHVKNREICDVCLAATRQASREARHKRRMRLPRWRAPVTAEQLAAVRALCAAQPDSELLMDSLGLLDIAAHAPVTAALPSLHFVARKD